ncbi:PTB domain-containing engulfment adapter protein 1-like isoform X2 [Ptychodera flava]|uniref:PTB domain-containing engulfment adapter protein 1-like isoform X2 n=1 Tax=Ptychodera flava TaxID=63121 RepID=UPI003969F485
MNKNWVHPPTALTQGHVIYNVKFLGQTEVEAPKGAELVKEAIRKLKFSRHIKKAEGNKPPKMELTISSEGLGLQEPKTKEKLYSYPLHRISYCADDKTDKKICAFIAKEQQTNKHLCFVLDSEKCAEEITLTVGQAFDLAYRKFLDTSGRDMEMKKQFIVLQKKLQEVEAENTKLRQRVAELEALTGQQSMQNNSVPSNTPVRSSSPLNSSVASKTPQLTLKEQALQHQQSLQTHTTSDHLFEMEPFSPTGAGTHNGFPQPSKSNTTLPLASPAVPIAPALAPPPPVPARPRQQPASNSTPPPQPRPVPAATTANQPSEDPFGSGPFTGTEVTSSKSNTDYDLAIHNIDKQMAEIKEGFGRGLTMANDDFSLEDLDPLNQK